MEPLTGIVAATALIASSVLINAGFPLDRRLANWLAVGILAWTQIVVGSIVLSELYAIGLPGFTLWHLFVLLLGLVVWLGGGKPMLASFSLPDTEIVLSFIRRNILLFGFVAALAGILVIVVLPTSFVDSDVAHYHIPRAHYWIQNHTARHFYTDDIRQVERPPNSSFLYMWQILVTGSYRGLNVPQWMAAVGTALAVAALSRSGGNSWEASILASAAFLSLPAVVLQMSAPWNDLLTAFGVATFTYFVIEGVVRNERRDKTISSHFAAYAGLAFGLMMGTKFTSFLPLPTLAVLLVALLILRFRQRLRPLLSLAAFCTTGFLLLGMYNYALNVAEFGRPIVGHSIPGFSSDVPIEIDNPGEPHTESSATADLIRHVYQVMDWTIVKPIPGADTLYAINNDVYRALDARLELGLESHPEFNLSGFGMRAIRSGEIGFGPLGYAVLLTAPFAIPVMILRTMSGRRNPVSVGLLLLGLATFVTQPIVGSWTAALTRYHSGAFALLIAALLPFAYSRRRLALVWLLPIGFLAVWSAYQTAARVRQMDEDARGLKPWQASILEYGLPADARIGVIGRVEFVHILEQFPGYRFEPVPAADLVPSLLGGGVDGALVLDPSDTYQRYRLPLEHDQSLLVRNGKHILTANLDKYGASLGSRDGRPMLHLESSGLIRRLGPDLVQIFVPTVGPVELGVPLVMELTFPVDAPVGDALAMICGESSLSASVHGRQMFIDIPPSAFDLSQPTQLCRLQIRELEFGGRIPSPTIELTLYPATK